MARKRLFDEHGNEVKGRMKKPFYKKWWFWLVVVLVVGSALSGGGDETEPSDKNVAVKNTTEKESVVESSETEIVKETEPEEKTYAIGEMVNVGKVAYVVNSVENATNVGGEYGQNSKGTYLLVNVTVTNNGDEALTVDNSLFKLLNDGKKYDSDTTAGMYANDNSSFFLESVNPELSLTGNIVFDVSETVLNSDSKQLEVSTGFWGTETDLINLQ